MVLRQSPPGHKTRCLEEDVILAIDNTTKNVIHYQKVQGQEEVEFPVVRKLMLGFGVYHIPCVLDLVSFSAI